MMVMSERRAAEVLGVDAGASAEDVHRAYRRRARELHPDAGGTAEAFAELRAAYQLLAAGAPIRDVTRALPESEHWLDLARVAWAGWRRVMQAHRLFAVATVVALGIVAWALVFLRDGVPAPVAVGAAVYGLAWALWWVRLELPVGTLSLRRRKEQPRTDVANEEFLRATMHMT